MREIGRYAWPQGLIALASGDDAEVQHQAATFEALDVLFGPALADHQAAVAQCEGRVPSVER